jgi:hypothetical protein
MCKTTLTLHIPQQPASLPRGVLSNGSNAEVLIAGTDLENRGVKYSVFYGTP